MGEQSTKPRTTSDVLFALEDSSRVLRGLACAVQIIGVKARDEGIAPSECIAVEILGEVMADQAKQLIEAIDEASALVQR